MQAMIGLRKRENAIFLRFNEYRLRLIAFYDSVRDKAAADPRLYPRYV